MTEIAITSTNTTITKVDDEDVLRLDRPYNSTDIELNDKCTTNIRSGQRTYYYRASPYFQKVHIKDFESNSIPF